MSLIALAKGEIQIMSRASDHLGLSVMFVSAALGIGGALIAAVVIPHHSGGDFLEHLLIAGAVATAILFLAAFVVAAISYR
jgi:hypothetical protein